MEGSRWAGTHLVLEASEIGIMSVVDLAFVTDNSEKVVFVQHVRARIPLVRWVSYPTLH